MNADPNARDKLLNDLNSSLSPASEPIADTPLAPPVIPDHELIRRIGRGSYGEVWLARTALGTWRAVKIVQRAAFDHDRPYEREFEGIRRFEPVSRTHPSQLNVLHVGRDDAAGLFYYVMELADDVTPVFQPASSTDCRPGDSTPTESPTDSPTGKSALRSAGFPTDSPRHSLSSILNPLSYRPRTLRSDLHHRGRLPCDECLRLGLALATTLDHLHRHGLVHRDIKPSNIVFVNGIPKLADIGLVTHVEATISFVGTEGYVPPEGPGTAPADIYSLGKVLYEMATGRDRQDYPDLPTNLIEAPAADRAALSELNEVIVKACHNDARQRYQTAAELHADLALLQSGVSVRRQRLLARRLRFVQRAGAVVTAIAAVIALGWWWQSRQTAQVRELAVENLTLAQRADANATLAQQNEAAARERLYAADINLAHQALLADNLRLARSLLQNHVPEPGQPDLRGFEWRYLWQQCRSEELFSLPAHTNTARVLAFSPDGQRIAVGGYFGTTMILDLGTRQQIAVLPGTNAIQSVEFSPDGEVLAIGSHLDVRLWDTRSFKMVRELPEAVAPALFSPDGRHLLSYRKPQSGKRMDPLEEDWRLDAWDTANWSVTNSLEFPVSGSRSGSRDLYVQPVFGADGKRLVVLAGDTIRVFSFPELREILVVPEKIPAGSASRPFIALSSDNRTLATASPVGFGVRLWDLEDNRELRVLPGHADHIFSAAFSPDGTVLATGSPDQTIKLWDVATGELLKTFAGQGDEVVAVVFSSDGKRLASLGISDAEVKLWDPKTRARRDSIQRPLWPVGFDADGSLVAFLSPGWNPVALDPATFELTPMNAPVPRDGAKYGLYLGSVSSDGKLQGLWGDGVDGSRGDVLEVWDRRLGKLLCYVPALSPLVSFANTRRLVATRTTNEAGLFTTTVWQLPSGTAKWAFTNQFEPVLISPDEQYLLAEEKEHFRLWRVEGEELVSLRTFKPAERFTSGAAFSPDGRLLATSARDIVLWSLPAMEVVGVLKGHTRASTQLAFSPDGRTLASIADDRTVRLWHVSTQRELIRFQISEQDQGHFQVEFSPDGRALAARRFNTNGPITWLHYAPSFAEIAVAEGGNYRTLAGVDPPTWLAVARALHRENRGEEALEACDEVLRQTANRDELAWLADKARLVRVSALKQLNRLDEASTGNCALLGIPARDPGTPAMALDLSAFFNSSLDWDRATESAPSDLRELPQGRQVFDGTVFDVRGQIALRGRSHDREWQFEPPRMDGIRVGRRLARLHFLHAAGGWDENIKTGDRLGHYWIHYEDGRSVELPIRFNVDTSDWWAHAHFPKELPEATVAWQGFTARSRPEGDQAIRLFKRTWQNPFPDAEVTVLDFVAEHPGVHPFLIALTTE